MEKLILVYYINVNGMSPYEAREHIMQIKSVIIKEDESIINIILPMREGNDRIECINPKMISEEEYSKYKETLVSCNAKWEEFLNQKLDV